MLRTFLIFLSKSVWLKKLFGSWNFAWRVASRFVAGETLDEGIRVARNLNEKGITATLDHLGEHVSNPDEAHGARAAIMKIAPAIEKAGVRANVSIKLTQLGLAVDEELCAENLEEIVRAAAAYRIFVRIDMEDSPWIDATLRLYRRIRFQNGLENVGVVIQSYLYRSEEDVRQLLNDKTRIRLCKGAYKEPPEVAFPKKSDVDDSYDQLGEMLMDCSLEAGIQINPDGKTPPIPALATHDEARIEHAKAYHQKIGLPKEGLEFQFLYGIRRDIQEQLVAEGYPVRVYVPYGTEWYPYFMRRLAERPANVWFFISNFLRK
jgi:proline dehydrogenase